MIHDRANWRIKARHAALVLTAAALPFAFFDGSAVQAQSVMRSPSLNVGSRMPSFSAGAAARIDSGLADRVVTGVDRTTPRLRPACSYAYRDSDGRCSDHPVWSSDGGNGGPSGKGKTNGPRRNTVLTTSNPNAIANELVAEIEGSWSDARTDAWARRHGLTRVGSQKFP